MIPVKLALRNFMPYRDNVPPLHFAGIHTASICGDNGNGKSALIDAITWALWGKTRAKNDDDLIHLGQTETEVEFDFAVGQQTYRVIRKHAKPKRRRASGQTILEFQIATNGGFRPISGNSIQETQQEIIRVLRMDYETFKNSAFLRQGHADEFTIANPAKRKQVLADILGLSLYDELEEQAKQLAKQQETEKNLAESAIKDISDELSQKPAYETELQQARNELSSLENLLQEQASRLNELRQKKEQLKNKQGQLTQLEEHTAATARALEHWHDLVKQHQGRINEYQELIARRVDIEDGYTQFTAAKRLSEELDQKLPLVNRLNQRQHELDMAIVRASQALLKEHALAESKIGELETTVRKLPQLKSEQHQVQLQLSQLAEQESALNQKKQALQELQAQRHILEASNSGLEKEIAEIADKLGLLLSESSAKCPLCETELGTDSLKLIADKYAAGRVSKSASLESNRAELARQISDRDSLQDEIARLEARLNQDKAAAQGKASLTSMGIIEANKAGTQLNEEKIRLAEIEERLARKDFATGEQAALRQIEGELAKLNYDSHQHEEVRRHLGHLEQYENPKRKLDEADRLINQEQEAAVKAEQAAQELGHSLETDKQKRQQLATEISSLTPLADELARTEAEHQTLSTRQKQAGEIVGNIRGKLERCAELETKVKEKGKVLSRATKEERIYRDLTQAFGKKGIQALLIEIALPEVETEANKLLGRMTDNRMHVKMETQRETKKGDVVETLDITIADELGTRNYEMFSGGEAFRINFAIRIALSKLLARRAGAPLPTLIIDEGFGTQDSTNLEKLKEAIISIQDDFEKILIITHIEELRDAFPTRIDVIKTTEGSTLEVS